MALAALGLWASLVPHVTYPSASSGEPSNEVLTAWPGWAVQQDLGPLSGVAGHFDIWVASEPNADIRLTLNASLVDAADLSVLRQTTTHVTPSDIPVRRSLRFPSYVVPEGQRLVLQLQVPDHYEHSVSYRLAPRQAAYESVMLNGVPDADGGPLSFSHLATSSGLRAGLNGEPDARIRLLLALLLSGLSGLAHPRSVAALRRAGSTGVRLAENAATWMPRFAAANAEPDSIRTQTGIRHVFAAPWYPWPAAVIPMLHFLASNPLHFAVRESVIPVGVALLAVSVAVALLRLVLKGWHQAAAAVTIVTAAIFAFGHVERAIDGRLGEQALFSASVVIAAAGVWLAIRSPSLVARSAPFLNMSAGILLLVQVTTLAGGLWRADLDASQSGPSSESLTTSHLFHQLPPIATANRPDIYYIILDAYGRHDALGDFDNSEFLEALEERGFSIALEATSNYRSSMQSLASSLNLEYLDNLGHRTPGSKDDIAELVKHNALATILKRLGYTYVHLESGWGMTDKSPLADIGLTFTPAGVLTSNAAESTGISYGQNAARAE